MPSDPDLQSILIRCLQTPAAYPHRADDISHLETHISHVFLAGDYAYKVKKPVDLGFLDFSSLEKRRHFCEEEVRLNRRLAPQIYLGVVPITASGGQAAVEGAGPVVEYAVKMRRFPQAALLSRITLSPEIIDRMAREVASFHGVIPRADRHSRFGTAAAVLAPVTENFKQIRGLLGDRAGLARLDSLEHWSRTRFERLETVLQGRKHDGFVRECHGDMHLGNMAMPGKEIIIFDGIEFSQELRWIDVMSEVAFVLMDLEHRGQGTLGWRFLNAYLELGGDYEGLQVLRFYQVYRAMVRAKVAVIRLGQAGLSEPERAAIMAEYLAYLALAEGFTRDHRPGVLITMGVSGSGKTTLSQPLLEQVPAIRIRSDVERKRLFGLAARARTDSGKDQGIYGPEATAATYERLLELTRIITRAGYTVLVDATFLKQGQRGLFVDFAITNRLPLLILELDAPEAALRQRVRERHIEGRDASEADIGILEAQLAGREPLTAGESKYALQLDVSGEPPVRQVLEHWRLLQG